MPQTKVRSDTQIAGKNLFLGGTDVDSGFGDVGAASVTLRKDTADTTSPILTIETRTGGSADVVVNVAGSVTVAGNLTVTGTTTTVETITINQDATITNDLTVNGNSLLGNEINVDTTTVNGGFTVIAGTSANQDVILRGDLRVKNQAGTTDQLVVLEASGNTTITGTLTVNGAGTSTFTGLTQHNGGVSIAAGQNLSMASGAGTATLEDTTINGTLDTTGNITTDGDLTINDDAADVTATLTLARTTGGNATLTWNGTVVALNNPLSVTGDVTTTTDFRANGDLVLNDDAGDVTVTISLERTTGGTATITWDGSDIILNQDTIIQGDLAVTGTITGAGIIQPGLKQHATFSSEPGVATGLGPGWDSSTPGPNRTLTLPKDSDGSTLGDTIDEENIFLGGSSVVDNDIPIMVFKDGLALRAGTGQDYTISSQGGTDDRIIITFLGALTTNDRILVTFGKTT